MVKGWIVAVITPGGGNAVVVAVMGEAPLAKAVSVSLMPPETNGEVENVMPPVLVITGVRPNAPLGPVTVTTLPDAVAV
jgi:hypothetical protein